MTVFFFSSSVVLEIFDILDLNRFSLLGLFLFFFKLLLLLMRSVLTVYFRRDHSNDKEEEGVL